MNTFLDKSLILNDIKLHYNFKSDAEFARFLDIKPQTLSTWHSRKTFDIELLYAKCVEIDANWLLTGKGSMLKEEKAVKTVKEAAPTATNCQETKALAEDRAYIIELQKKEIGRLEQELATLQRTLQTKKTI